jgi:arylsulfatase A-like enzyme
MNIILIISDTYRYDNLFDRAEMPVRTPELDRFSERAVSASNMHVGSFPTIPHRTDLTTGRYIWPWGPWQDLDQSSKNHAPRILREHGYVSQLICDCPHLFNSKFHPGFDGAVQTRGQEGDKPFIRMNDPLHHVMPLEKDRGDRSFQGFPLSAVHSWTNREWHFDERENSRFAPRTASLAVEWLEENYRFHPFFLWADLFDPHEPWDPPEYMVRRYDPDYDGPPMIHPNYGKASDLTPAELKNLRAHYCAEAEMVDRAVGRILQKIDDLGLWDDSIVIFTTDHGMSLGEHNCTGKSNINEGDDRNWPIYPEIAHIPFMIAAPGLAGGRTIDALLQPPDILPTLLDLAGVNVEPPEPFHGRSFAPMLRGEAQREIRSYAVSGAYMREHLAERGMHPVVYTHDWAYVPVGPHGECELYDRRADPYATRDLAGEHPDVVDEMHEMLLGWLREMDAPEDGIKIWER